MLRRSYVDVTVDALDTQQPRVTAQPPYPADGQDEGLTHSWAEGLGLGTDEREAGREAEHGHTLTELTDGSDAPLDTIDRLPAGEDNGGDIRLGWSPGRLLEDPSTLKAANHSGLGQCPEALHHTQLGQRIGRAEHPIDLDDILDIEGPAARQYVGNSNSVALHSYILRITAEDVKADFDVGEDELPEGGPGDLGVDPDPILAKRARAMDVLDLPPGIAVEIEQIGTDFVVGYTQIDPRGAKSGIPSRAPIHGYVAIDLYGQSETYPDLYEVTAAAASHGWGPLLYNVAIELATKYGDGLISDRAALSDAARNVWRHYYDKRTDIEKEQGTKSTLPRKSVPAEPAITHIYRSNGMPTIKALRDANLLVRTRGR